MSRTGGERESEHDRAAVADVRGIIEKRYEEIKSGRVKPIDGEEAFESLRRKSQEWRACHSALPMT